MDTKTPKKKRRKLRILAGTALILVCGVFFYSCATQRHMEKEIAAAPRNPVTGVVIDTEAITIEPTNTSAPGTSRTACLLIHGFLSSRQDFADLGQRLADEGITVRLMRIPGHGTTPADLGYQPPDAALKAVRAEFKQLRDEYDQVYVGGFSMGGSLATLLASDSQVDKLVLLAAYYGVTYKWFYILPPETWNATLGRFIKFLIRPMYFIKVNDKESVGKFFFYSTIPTAAVRALTKLGKEAHKEEVLENITCPILMIHSTGDEAASAGAAQKAYGKMGSKEKDILLLEKSNHVLLWDLEREKIKDKIVEFLTNKDKP